MAERNTRTINIPLGTTDHQRNVAESAQIPVLNRYFEQNPVINEGVSDMLSRPALRKWLDVGSGPIRGMFCQPGMFEDCLFIVSDTQLYRVDKDESVTLIYTGLAGSPENYVPMCSTDNYMFLADGSNLYYYDGSTLQQITMPDDVGAVWVDTIALHVIVVCAQGFGVNGRFYWVEPGATTVDPLNFATAERSPDPLFSVITLGDQFWLFGSSTVEAWYPTGDGAAPFARIQGRLFDRGIWEGAACKIGDRIVLVDADGVAWLIGEGGISRISNHGVEERMREAIAETIRTP